MESAQNDNRTHTAKERKQKKLHNFDIFGKVTRQHGNSKNKLPGMEPSPIENYVVG